MSFSARYAVLLAELPHLEISFGYGGVRIFPDAELDDAQVGYARMQDGTSLIATDQGAWHSEWIVIGSETCCGDPIFIDTGEGELPVFTAMHGEGEWNPKKIAISLEAFGLCLRALARIVQGREDPVALEENPVQEDELASFVAEIESFNPGLKTEFWELMLST